jgi:DNA adenine methylase
MVAKLLRHVPPGGHPYCEPYMGGASLFFARDPAPVEVLNDLDGDLVNLFRCLQDPATFPELRHRLTHTLYSRAEFCRALDILAHKERADPILRAWAFFVRQNMAFAGQLAATPGDWGRSFTASRRGGAETTSRWMGKLATLDAWHKRLLRVQIEQLDALEVIKYWDTKDTVFYLDPPYHLETRVGGSAYRCEATHDHHVALVDVLLRCEGAVVLSGYDHPVYEPLRDAGWHVASYSTSCHAAGRTRASGLQGLGAATAYVPRTETVWSNPRAAEMLRDSQASLLFEN